MHKHRTQNILKAHSLINHAGRSLKKLAWVFSIGGMGSFCRFVASDCLNSGLNAESVGSTALAGIYDRQFRIWFFHHFACFGALSGGCGTIMEGKNIGAQQRTRDGDLRLDIPHDIYGDLSWAFVTGIYLLFASYLAGIFTDIPEIQAIRAPGLQVIELAAYVFLPWNGTYLRHFNGPVRRYQDARVDNIACGFCVMEIPLAYFGFYIWVGYLGFFAIAFSHSFRLSIVKPSLFSEAGKWKTNEGVRLLRIKRSTILTIQF